jgi:hypothetical protein
LSASPVIAAPTSTMDRIAQRSLALSPAVVLGGLTFVSALVRTLLALRHHATSYWPDEWIYAGLSRSIGHGHLTIHGDAAHFPAILQPLLAAPLWRFFSIETAYQLIQVENAVAASLVVVPIYLLARYVGLTRYQGYMCAIYALVIPALVWITVTISDFVAYPLAIGAIAAAVRALDRPSPRGQAIFLALTVLATLARLQYFVIAIGYLAAALWLDRRRAFRMHAIAFGTLAPVFLGVLIGAFGYYRFDRGSFSISTLTWIPLQAYLLAGITGAVIVPGAVAGLIRPRARSQRAFAIVVPVFAISLLAEVSVLSALEGRLRERYLFVLLPLAAVSFFMYLQRGRPYGRLVLIVAAALAGAAAYLPVTRYSKEAVSYDSESMIAVSWLQDHTSTTITGLVVAIAITIGSALALLTGRRIVAGVAVPIAIAASVLITIPATQWDISTHHTRPEALRWVDRAVDGQPVTLIATPSSANIPMLSALYWNESITREFIIRPTLGTDNYARTALQVAANGSFLRGSGYFLYNRQGTHATIDGATVVKRVDDLVLYRSTSESPRFVDLVKGQLSNGFLSPYTELNVWGPGRATHVTFTLFRPKHVPAATLLLGRQRFVIKAGASARFACTSTRSPFAMTIRSLSEIPDEWNRPVIVKMTGLRAAASSVAPAKPGCALLRS